MHNEGDWISHLKTWQLSCKNLPIKKYVWRKISNTKNQPSNFGIIPLTLPKQSLHLTQSGNDKITSQYLFLLLLSTQLTKHDSISPTILHKNIGSGDSAVLNWKDRQNNFQKQWVGLDFFHSIKTPIDNIYKTYSWYMPLYATTYLFYFNCS